jgi:GxxExxY protein
MLPIWFATGRSSPKLKVMDRLTNIEVAQLINYLKVTKLHVGLLFNFGSLGQLEWKRYVI